MKPVELLEILHFAERLKNNTRHCYTSSGRHESVAEHSWRLALMAELLREEFPELDMDRVVSMCLIHDLGEAFTGDIPAFQKTEADEQTEVGCVDAWFASLPQPLGGRLQSLYAELSALRTPEARFYKALDRMEAVIAHNESDISTWLPLEYELQRTYGIQDAAHFSWLQALRAAVLQETEEKIAAAKQEATL